MKTIPDYGSDYPYTPSVLLDVGESAARINKLSMINRTGRIIYWDIFDTLDGWFSDGSNKIVGAVPGSSRHVFTGVSMLRLHAVPFDLASITRYVPAIDRLTYGIEFYLSFNSTQSFYFEFTQGYLTQGYLYKIRYDLSNQNWYFFDTLITHYDIGYLVWHQIKAVYDVRNRKCLYLILDGVPSIVGLDPQIVYSDTINYNFSIATSSLGSIYDSYQYIDNVIITVDEPEIMPIE